MTTAVLLANDFAHCAKPVMFRSLLPFVATKYGTDFECSRHLQQILVNVFCLSHNLTHSKPTSADFFSYKFGLTNVSFQCEKKGTKSLLSDLRR